MKLYPCVHNDVVIRVGISFCAGTPQNSASNKAAAASSITTAQQQSTPPTASTGFVGNHQATPGSSLADITPSVRSRVCVCVCEGFACNQEVFWIRDMNICMTVVL